jgi:hypothetical protein
MFFRTLSENSYSASIFEMVISCAPETQIPPGSASPSGERLCYPFTKDLASVLDYVSHVKADPELHLAMIGLVDVLAFFVWNAAARISIERSEFDSRLRGVHNPAREAARVGAAVRGNWAGAGYATSSSLMSGCARLRRRAAQLPTFC